jgi:hypothetical protein
MEGTAEKKGKKLQKTLQFGQNNQLILGPAQVFIHG